MRGRALLSYLLILAMLMVETGCVGLAGMGAWEARSPTTFTDVDNWMKQAQQYAEEGDLARALQHLRIARTLDPGDERIDAEIMRLKSQALLLATQYTKQAKDAAKLGQMNAARKAYLRVLSLQPGQIAALEGLRSLEQVSAEHSMARKIKYSRQLTLEYDQAKSKPENGKEAAVYVRQSEPQPNRSSASGLADYRQRLDRRIENNPEDRAARQLLIRLEIEQVERSFRQERFDQALGHLAKGASIANGDSVLRQSILDAQKKYGRLLYSMGLRIFRDDLIRAKGYWDYALRFDPENEKSRLRLNNAQGG